MSADPPQSSTPPEPGCGQPGHEKPERAKPGRAPLDARRGAARAALLVVVIAASMQIGSALAVKVIGSLGIVEALWLRTAVAAALLAVVRPGRLHLPERGDRWPVAALTLALLAMNLSFYGAITHAPVGIVVAIEFMGPLAVAVIGTRRPLDLLWVGLAGAGVIVLAGPAASVTTLGLVLSLSAATMWAAYLLLAKRAVAAVQPLTLATLMLGGSALVLTPVLFVGGVQINGHGAAILLGVLVAVLSSAFPYFLEMVAIALVRASTYGVLLSIEPAVAALAGWLVLSQRLTLLEAAAMVAVMIAAAGASWTSGPGAEALETPTV